MDITSRKNDKVIHMRKLGASREYRRASNEYLCDGIKLLREAVKWNAPIHDVFICEALPNDIDLPNSAKVYNVTREIIEAVSPLKNPQSVIFSVGLPETQTDGSISGGIVLENMQDPGNVGTMLRTANAFGIDTVILCGSCADPWSAKAVRASMGAIFRQKIMELTLAELIAKSSGVRLLGAALRDDAEDIRDCDLNNCAVVIGNEGGGISQELLDACGGSVIIPMRPECESLNAAAAAAVIMWEMQKRNI